MYITYWLRIRNVLGASPTPARSISGVVRPMRPRPNVLEQGIAGATGGLHLPRPNQLIVAADVPQIHPLPYQALGGLDLSLWGRFVVEAADEGDADAPGIVAEHLRAHVHPPPALVHVAVAAHQEAVGDVVPVARLHREALHETDVRGAGGDGGAFLGGAVHYYDVGDGVVEGGEGRLGRRGQPFAAADYSWLIGCVWKLNGFNEEKKMLNKQKNDLIKEEGNK